MQAGIKLPAWRASSNHSPPCAPGVVHLGLAPGVGRAFLGRNAIRMTLELPSDVANRPIQVSLVECCGEESTTPLDAAGNASICPHRSHALGQPHEVAQARLRPEADYQVDVVC